MRAWDEAAESIMVFETIDDKKTHISHYRRLLDPDMMHFVGYIDRAGGRIKRHLIIDELTKPPCNSSFGAALKSVKRRVDALLYFDIITTEIVENRVVLVLTKEGELLANDFKTAVKELLNSHKGIEIDREIITNHGRCIRSTPYADGDHSRN